MLLINLPLKTGICRSARRGSQQPKLQNFCKKLYNWATNTEMQLRRNQRTLCCLLCWKGTCLFHEDQWLLPTRWGGCSGSGKRVTPFAYPAEAAYCIHMPAKFGLVSHITDVTSWKWSSLWCFFFPFHFFTSGIAFSPQKRTDLAEGYFLWHLKIPGGN